MQGILYLLPFILLSWFGISFFFKSAGYAQWKAFVPVYNVVIWLKIIKKPLWWTLLSFIPVVNMVLFIGMVVELLNSFGIRGKVKHVIAAVIPYLYLPYLGLKTELVHTGPVDYNTQKKGEAREWAEALFFAIIAATAIRAFVLEAFVIPTGSMERTLRVYDCLFVNKMSYGTRFTMTPLSVPFSHQTIMGTSIKSYSDLVQFPYFRFPGFEEVDNGDMVVFNYPQEDYHPIDKRSHYIKRCVGIAGDSLQIVDGDILINGEEFEDAETSQGSYWVDVKASGVDINQLFETYQISPSNRNVYGSQNGVSRYRFSIPDNLLKQLESEPFVVRTERVIVPNTDGGNFFDKTKNSKWSVDNFGPIYIPKAGDVITIHDDNFWQYHRLISVYEGGEIHNIGSLTEMITGIDSLNNIMNGINVENIFVSANRSFQQHGMNSHELYGVVGFCQLVTKNFITVNIPDGISKLADQFYWKDNSNYSDDDMKSLASEFVQFVKTNSENQKNALKELGRSLKGDKNICLINGELTNKYKVKQDYYFMIGDNRHGSADSREWGYVPGDHIVGKPVFVWMSLDDTKGGFGMDKIRWDRVCSFVDADGLSRSFKWEVLILIIGWTAANRLYFKPRKEKKKVNKAA